MTAAVTFAAAFVALYVGHQLGDQWVQTHHQATHKHLTGWAGRINCALHVVTLTATKAFTVAVTAVVVGLPLSWPWATGAFLIDAGSHYWADRRTTLAGLAERIRKGAYYRLGTPREGRDDPITLGTGSYHLDQAWHEGWLWITALLIAAGAS